jgi:uncharacterized Zn finger protein
MPIDIERLKRGIKYVEEGRVKRVGEEIVYKVKGSDDTIYKVVYNVADMSWKCDCPDFKYNECDDCKHIFACKVEDGLI